MAEEVISPGDFEAFYRGLRPDRSSYLWQRRAARELAEGEPWDALEAPTGAGKTTLIECYLFALAVRAHRPERGLPRRLFWVVDRRSVVDEVFEEAAAVKHALATSQDPVVQLVAAALRSYAGDTVTEEDEPVQVQRWRGGTARESAVISPVLPAVICSTVDQVGSRLLFRGYGTARRSRPIEAALVGTDSLIVLDEAHISEPFEATAAGVACFQRTIAASPAPPLSLLRVSATLPNRDAQHRERARFALTEKERLEPSLARRLDTVKGARLVKAQKRVDGLIREARRLPGDSPMLIGVIANTVNEARQVHSQLASRANALLVIGPCRPLDRAAVMASIPAREDRGGLDEPRFVVATQTIEVGVNLDFDGLVTACAPFSALVQRFGRLDRAGYLKETDAVIVASSQPCPVYGDATARTWEWLGEQAKSRAGHRVVDMGPRSVALLADAGPPEGPRAPQAPILAPWHVDALGQTSAEPVPSPDVEPFLHGESDSPADVRIAWRADLLEPTEADSSDARTEDWIARVARRRPHENELLSAPLIAARRWLAGSTPAVFADIESGATLSGGDDPGARPFLRVPPPLGGRLSTPELLIDAAEIRPGDVLVVPAAAGGCDAFGWNPTNKEPVTDLGDLDSRRPRVRLDSRLPRPEHLMRKALHVAEELAGEAVTEREAFESLIEVVSVSLREQPRAWLPEGVDPAWATLYAGELGRLADAIDPNSETPHGPGRVERYPADGGSGHSLLLRLDPPARRHGRPVGYPDHVREVEKLAEQLAWATGLADTLITTIGLAARAHDTGKLDPRFQIWLNDGLPADPAAPLAKSGRADDDRRVESARLAAQWPRGKRHETLSAALLHGADSTVLGAVDRDLALHLVATHHGQNRPFYGDPLDPAPVDVTVEIEGTSVTCSADAAIPWGEHAMRFTELLRRYGHWGLAALEAVLVLADRTVSSKEGADE